MSAEQIPKILAHGLSHAELKAECVKMGLQPFRADQLAGWLYVQLVDDFSRMKNISAADRDRLAAVLEINSATICGRSGEAGATGKLLLRLRDGEEVESVLIPARDRRTVCISSQAGCRFACAFCASGQAGFRRNLEAGEMVGQAVAAAREFGAKPSHVVFMGIGEPFDNYDNVIKAARIINSEHALGIGARRITLSTCGVVPGIDRLADEGIQFELSVSLHSASHKKRSELMPVNRKYTLPDLVESCRRYTRQTGRIITFEYTMIKGVNDSRSDALMLVDLLKGLKCRINLIPLSPVSEYNGGPPGEAAISEFMAEVSSAGINVTLRASKGKGINAACGQLRYRRRDDSGHE